LSADLDSGLIRVMRWVLVVALGVLAGCAGAAGRGDAGGDSGARPRVVIVAGTPSHLPREHEFRAGALLLRRFLNEVGVEVDVVPGGWPADPSIFAGARAVGFYADGGDGHPLVQGTHLATLMAALGPDTGFFSLHAAVTYPDASIPQVLPVLGGAYQFGVSSSPNWTATVERLPGHPATRGVAPFVLEDELYFNLVFAKDHAPMPLLQAVPPDALRDTPDSAMHTGRAETLAWAYDRPDGGRAFGYTGMHYHARWGLESVRRLITNAILWTAHLEIPAGGAPVTLEPAWLDENLDPK
jgi:hypothetical protein